MFCTGLITNKRGASPSPPGGWPSYGRRRPPARHTLIRSTARRRENRKSKKKNSKRETPASHRIQSGRARAASCRCHLSSEIYRRDCRLERRSSTLVREGKKESPAAARLP